MVGRHATPPSMTHDGPCATRPSCPCQPASSLLTSTCTATQSTVPPSTVGSESATLCVPPSAVVTFGRHSVPHPAFATEPSAALCHSPHVPSELPALRGIVR